VPRAEHPLAAGTIIPPFHLRRTPTNHGRSTSATAICYWPRLRGTAGSSVICGGNPFGRTRHGFPSTFFLPAPNVRQHCVHVMVEACGVFVSKLAYLVNDWICVRGQI
jgi:hypothetical protein